MKSALRCVIPTQHIATLLPASKPTPKSQAKAKQNLSCIELAKKTEKKVTQEQRLARYQARREGSGKSAARSKAQTYNPFLKQCSGAQHGP